MQFNKTASNILLSCALMLCVCITVQSADAAILSGYFPMHQGKYWNFSCPQETGTLSWAINGDFNLRDVGSVFMMYQGSGRALCMKQDWEGVRVYAEITPDALYMPETPYLFLPRDIPTKIGAVMQETVSFKIYTSPKHNGTFEQTGSETRHVRFEFKRSEDVEAGGRLHAFCVVIERVTRRNNDAPVKETLWLAQGIGPVKIRIESGVSERVYTAQSRAGSEKAPKSYGLKRYFPLKPGLRWTYQDQSGNQRVHETRIPLQSKLAEDMELIPFEDYLHDVRFVTMRDKGLAMPQQYWSENGFCQADPDQDQLATILLPANLQTGVFTITRSHTISRRWPSMSEMAVSDLELIYSSVPVAVEDVTTPVGVFENCLKISLARTARVYAMGFDLARVGYIWLAPKTGIVKEDLINLYHYTDPKAAHSVFDVRLWELAQFEKVSPVQVLSYQNEKEFPPAAARARTVVPVRKTVSADGLIWENNSREMYEKAVEMAPFFVRPLAKKKMMDSIRSRTAAGENVSEDMVILSVKESAGDSFTPKTRAELEKIRTQ